MQTALKYHVTIEVRYFVHEAYSLLEGIRVQVLYSIPLPLKFSFPLQSQRLVRDAPPFFTVGRWIAP
jgi:hypothetical protein